MISLKDIAGLKEPIKINELAYYNKIADFSDLYNKV